MSQITTFLIFLGAWNCQKWTWHLKVINKKTHLFSKGEKQRKKWKLIKNIIADFQKRALIHKIKICHIRGQNSHSGFSTQQTKII
jgi:hypothetical protein